MKVDVLNLKGNKRSGKLTTDEKKKLCPGIPAYQLWAPSYQLRIEKARGLERKGQTLRENTGKGKIRANMEIKAKEQGWKRAHPVSDNLHALPWVPFPNFSIMNGWSWLKAETEKPHYFLPCFAPHLCLTTGNNSGLGKPHTTAAATICTSTQLSQLWAAACQVWTDLRSSSLLVTNGLDTVRKVGLFNSGWIQDLVVSCILHCFFLLVSNKLCPYSLLGLPIHTDLSGHRRFPDDEG